MSSETASPSGGPLVGSTTSDTAQPDFQAGPWRALALDRVWWWFVPIFGILHLPYLLPILGPEETYSYASYYAGTLQQPLVVLLLLAGLGRIRRPRERLFWGFLALAFALWWLNSITNAFLPWDWWTPAADLATDLIYGGYYVAWFLAATMAPHRSEPLIGDRSERLLRSLGSFVMAVGLLVYFVVVPNGQGPESELPWLPSLYMYLALDFVLIVVLARLAMSVESRRWRWIYGFLTLSCLLGGVCDLLELWVYEERLDWSGGGPSEVLWSLPIVSLAIAARLRHVDFPSQAWRETELSLARRTVPRPSPLMLSALVFPLVHLLFERMGMVAAETSVIRERVILVCLASLGILAWVENRLLQRKAVKAEVALQEIQSLRVAREVAAQAEVARSRFVASISHEIRTPLTGIVGMASMLREIDLPKKERQYAEMLDQSAEGLLATIDNLLEYSKIEAGQLRLELLPVELATLLASVTEHVRQAAEARGLELSMSVDSSAPSAIEADVGRLRQVLTTLLANALKFTDRGEIHLRLAARPLLVGDQGLKLLRFSVEDTGIGIDLATRSRLFQPFSQADTSTSRRFSGTGLGLAICHRIITSMGGDIGVDSELGQGSVFWFEIPVAASGEARGSEESPDLETLTATVEGGPSRGRVLVAEDDPVSRMIVQRQLQALGFVVHLVGNGSQALAALADQEPDLFLVDCRMPGVDGFEATRRWRQREEAGNRLPIIGMSAGDGLEMEKRCLAAGMDAYLPKPIDRARLIEVVDRWNLTKLAASTGGSDTRPGGRQ